MSNLIVADPDKTIRKTILEVLKPFKHRVFEAEDGEQVLKFMKEKKIHALLFDSELPSKGGLDLIPEVKKIAARTSVVAMVGLGDDAGGLMSKGALSTLTKPFSIQRLREAVSHAVDHSLRAQASPKPWKKMILASAACAFLFAGAGAGYRVWKLARAPIKLYSIPYDNLSGLASDGKFLWTCDWFSQAVYRHSPDAVLSLRRTYAKDDLHPSAVAWDGKNLWVYAAWENKLVKCKTDDLLSVEQTYEAPEVQPYAMSFDGKDFWYCDQKKSEMGRFVPEGAGLKIIETIPTPGKKPVGVFKTAEFLWTADGQSGLIYKHSLAKGYPELEAYGLPQEMQSEKITCFGSDGEVFWAGSDASHKVVQFRKNNLKLAASSD